MNEILCLLGKSKKYLFNYAKDNKIECYKDRKNVYSFKVLFLNMQHICEVHIYNNIIYNINLFVVDENELCLELINIYKEYFNANYGTPISDNTNHPTDYIDITYKKDNHVVYVFSQSNSHKTKIVISVTGTDIYKKDIKKNKFINYIIYLIGGIVFGLLMFVAMFYNNYSWINFGICMVGGLFFAVLFGLLFEISMNLSLKPTKINFKHIKRIEQHDTKLEHLLNSYGQLVCTKNIRSKIYTAKIYLDNNLFIILYYKKGKIHKIEEKIDLLSKNLGFGFLSFELDNMRFTFNLHDSEEFTNIKKYIDEKLGYNSQEFIEIYSLVKKIIIEYNPYSLYKSENETVFDCEIEIISRRIFENNKMTFDEFKEVVLVAFDYDDSTQIYEELAKNLYDSIIKIVR